MLRAEGLSEEEALEVFAEIAKHDRRALPVVAGLAARVVTRGRTGHLSRPARAKMVRSMKAATMQITRRHGTRATPAVAKVVRSVVRNTSGRPVSIGAKLKMVRKAAGKVSQSRSMVAKLARTSPHTKRLARLGIVPTIRTYGHQPGTRTFRTAGPSIITVTPA